MKRQQILLIAALLPPLAALSGCYGKIGTPGIHFDGETIAAPKTIYARVNPGWNSVRDVEVTMELHRANGQQLGPVTIPREGDDGTPLILRDGNRFYLPNNFYPLGALSAPGDTLNANWRFTLGGAVFTPEHERQKSFSYTARITDLVIDSVAVLGPDGSEIEPAQQNGPLDLPWETPVTIRIRFHNLPGDAVTVPVPFRVSEHFTGGAVVSGGLDLHRSHFGGVPADQVAEMTISNVRFHEPQNGNIFRELWVTVNQPPEGALLEANPGNNLATTFFRLVAPGAE